MVDITIDTVTEGSLTGNGSFDKLMRVAAAHLKNEYTSGRIDGEDYSTVYLGIVQSAMAQSIQFELQRELQSAQANLIKQQEANAVLEGLGTVESTKLVVAKTATEGSNKKLVDAQVVTQGVQQLDIEAGTVLKESQNTQVLADTLNIPKQGLLLDKQAEKLTADIAVSVAQKSNLIADGLNIPKQGLLLDKQVLDVSAGIELKGQQVLNLASERNLTDEKVTSEEINQTLITEQKAMFTQQRTNLQAEALNIPKQGTVLTNQAAKIVADTTLSTQQKTNLVSEELKIDAETALIGQNKTNAVTQNTVLTSQKSKIDSEKSLLDQKKATEEAQIKDTASGVTVAGVIGKQKALYARQTEGFEWDAQVKRVKAANDVYAIAKSNDPDAVSDPNNMISVLQTMLSDLGR